jgi:glycerol-3-phosphate acyltransferase PlsX
VPAAAPPAIRRHGQRLRTVALGIDAPRIGLLSIGEEATKGNELTRESHRLLKASMPSFIGNVEARMCTAGRRT